MQPMTEYESKMLFIERLKLAPSLIAAFSIFFGAGTYFDSKLTEAKQTTTKIQQKHTEQKLIASQQIIDVTNIIAANERVKTQYKATTGKTLKDSPEDKSLKKLQKKQMAFLETMRLTPAKN